MSFRTRGTALWSPGRERQLLAVSCAAIWAGIGVLFVFYGYGKTWGLWKVPTLSPFFLDLRLVPAMAEALRMGIDPVLSNPTDPVQRVFNYPRLWYMLAYTGLSQKDTLWLGILMIALFFAGVLFFPGRMRRSTVGWMLLVLFSPACMLLYERANFDLLIFSLCALSVILLEKHAADSAVALFAASLLKLFPFFGMGMFLFRGRRIFWLVFLCLVIPFAAYLALTAQNVSASWNLTQRGSDLSYGVTVILSRYEPAFKAMMRAGLDDPHQTRYYVRALHILVYSLAAGIGLIALVSGWLGKFRPAESDTRNQSAFWMGAGIYCGTFFLGNNWDYRLVFLVLIVPALSDWIADSSGRQRNLLLSTMILVLLCCWYLIYNPGLLERGYPALFILDEVFNWCLFGELMFLMGASFPEWVRASFSGFPRLRRAV